MEKEVLIHVKGLHMMDTPEGDEPIEIVVPGEYYFRNGSHYLRYEYLNRASATWRSTRLLLEPWKWAFPLPIWN